MIKAGADIFEEPLTLAIDCCLRQSIFFPDNAKIDSVVPLDNGKSERFSQDIRNQLVSYFDKYCLRLYQHIAKNYSPQQVHFPLFRGMERDWTRILIWVQF